MTLETAEQKLQQWLAADAAVAQAQEYEIEGRKVTKANAYQVRENIEYWQRWVNRLSGTRRRVAYGVRR